MKPTPATPSPSAPQISGGPDLACTACGRSGAVEFMGARLCAECYQQGASSCAGGRELSESANAPECGPGD
jgi:hypothetical protein